MNNEVYFDIVSHLLLNVLKVEEMFKGKSPDEHMKLISTFMLNIMDMCKNNETKDYFLSLLNKKNNLEIYKSKDNYNKQLDIAQSHILEIFTYLNGILTSGCVLDPTNIGECELFYHPHDDLRNQNKYKDVKQKASDILMGLCTITACMNLENLSKSEIKLIVKGCSLKQEQEVLKFFNNYKNCKHKDVVANNLALFADEQNDLLKQVNNNYKEVLKLKKEDISEYIVSLENRESSND